MHEYPNLGRHGSDENLDRVWIDPPQQPFDSHHNPNTYLFDMANSPQQPRSDRPLPSLSSEPSSSHLLLGFRGRLPSSNQFGTSSAHCLTDQIDQSECGWIGNGMLDENPEPRANSNPPYSQSALPSNMTTDYFQSSGATSPSNTFKYHPISPSPSYAQNYRTTHPSHQDYWTVFSTRGMHPLEPYRNAPPHDRDYMVAYKTGLNQSSKSSSSVYDTPSSSGELEWTEWTANPVGQTSSPFTPQSTFRGPQSALRAPYNPASGEFSYDTEPGPPMLQQYLANGPPVQRGNNSVRSNDDQHLALPRHQGSDVAPSSPGTSTASAASSSTPHELPCTHDRCGSKFTGEYRKGNLARHMRLKHANGTRTYPCEAGCGKEFNRQDARLKHYRKRHPELATGPAVPRGPFQS